MTPRFRRKHIGCNSKSLDAGELDCRTPACSPPSPIDAQGEGLEVFDFTTDGSQQCEFTRR